MSRSARHGGTSPRSRSVVVGGIVAVVVAVTTAAFAFGPNLTMNSGDGAGAVATQTSPVPPPSALPTATPVATSTSTPAQPQAPSVDAPTRAPATTVGPVTTRPPVSAAVPRTSGIARNARVSVFGDSVLLGAAPAITSKLPRAKVDAIVARQSAPTFSAVRAALRNGTIADAVVIHVGTNGSIERKALNSLLRDLGPRRVVLVNAHVPRPWQNVNNRLIDGVAAGYASVRVVDWHGVARQRSSWIAGDGVHPTPSGSAVLAGLIRATLG